MASLTLAFADAAALQTVLDRDLSKGRAFVPGAGGVGPLESCDLTVTLEGRAVTLRGEAVFVKEEGPGRGVGLTLTLDAAALEALRALLEPPPAPAPARAAARDDDDDDPQHGTLFERIRGLSHTEQQRLAASGTMAERVALERAFGANVWESLLGNPRLTIPEVARIARKGTLPRPLIEGIAGHPSWLGAPEVQRALLGNPRSTAAIITRVLQSMSRAELVLVPQQTGYAQATRAAARKMLGK